MEKKKSSLFRWEDVLVTLFLFGIIGMGIKENYLLVIAFVFFPLVCLISAFLSWREMISDSLGGSLGFALAPLWIKGKPIYLLGFVAVLACLALGWLLRRLFWKEKVAE